MPSRLRLARARSEGARVGGVPGSQVQPTQPPVRRELPEPLERGASPMAPMGSGGIVERHEAAVRHRRTW